MNKDHILQEIKRTAKANDGVPLGRRNFAAENLPWLALRKRKGSLERNRQYRSGRDLAAVAVLATLFSLCEEP
jgi:hypothetical protein